MNNQQKLVEQLYQNSCSPIFLFDEKTQLLWNNDAAELTVDRGKIDKLHQLCFTPDLTAAGENLLRGISCQVNGNPIQGLGPVTLIPVGERHEMILALLTQKPADWNPPRLHDIISNVAAQYREPVFAIHNMLAPIKKELERYDCHDSFVYVDRIAQKCYETMRATTNLANYFLYHSLDVAVRKKRVDIHRFIEDMCLDIRQLVKRAGIVFDYQLCGAPVISEIDPDKLANAIYCLVANSCLYTSPGNEIVIRLLKANDDYIITVADKGVGIPPEVQPHIFEPFYSYDPNGSLASGVGLGLTIVQRVVEMHQGSCMVTSELNRGTTVALRIPIQDNPGASIAECSFGGGIMNRFSPLYLHLADICKINTVEIL